MERDFDQWLLGHWHYRASYRNIRVNGTIKGFDEYAMVNSFDFQPPPVQDLFLVSPLRQDRSAGGIIAEWPVFCQAHDEPWLRPGA